MWKLKPITFLMVVLGSTLQAQESGSCSIDRITLLKDRNSYISMQRYVDAGHQPWRTDAPAVAASEIYGLMKVPQQYVNVYDLPLVAIVEKDREAIYTYFEPVEQVSYRIHLRRYRWLLKQAGNRKAMVWVPVIAVKIDCSPNSRMTNHPRGESRSPLSSSSPTRPS